MTPDLEITVKELKKSLENDPSLTVLDVREPIELSEGRIVGSLHIPLGQVMRRMDELPGDRPFVIVCASGARSLMAARYLSQKGFTCRSLAGGMHAWERG